MYLSQNPKTAYRMIKDEAVIIDLSNSMLYSLNIVASLIWKMIDGKTTIEQIVENIEQEFDVERLVAENDCTEFINDFISKGLILEKEN